jgi:membrane associated rhomboid family serine protease
MLILPCDFSATMVSQPRLYGWIAGWCLVVTITCWVVAPATAWRGVAGFVATSNEATSQPAGAAPASAGPAGAAPMAATSAALAPMDRFSVLERWMQIQGEARPAMTEARKLEHLAQVDQALAKGDLTTAQADSLKAKLGACPVVSKNATTVLSALRFSRTPAEQGQVLRRAKIEHDEGLLTDREWTLIQGVAPGVSPTRQDLPLLLLPAGQAEPWWRALTTTFVHLRVLELAPTLLLFVSFAFVLEGALGKWRFFGLFGSLVGLTATLTWLMAGHQGLRDVPVQLAPYGLGVVNLAMAGFLLGWMPGTYLRFRRWLFVPLTEVGLTLGRLVVIQVVVQICIEIGQDQAPLGIVAHIGSSLLLGLVIAVVAVWRGWIQGRGQDLLAQLQIGRPGSGVTTTWVRSPAPNPGITVSDRSHPGRDPLGAATVVGDASSEPDEATSMLPREREAELEPEWLTTAGSESRLAPAPDHGSATTSLSPKEYQRIQERVAQCLGLGRADEALGHYQRLHGQAQAAPLALLDKLAKHAYKAGHFSGALLVAGDLIRQYPQACDDARLIAAAVYVAELHQPDEAIAHLDALDPTVLKEARRQRANELRQRAEAMRNGSA